MNNYTQSKIALGSEVTLTLVSDSKVEVEKLFKVLWQKIDNFESKFSRFKNSSELSRLNANAGSKQYVSEEFIKITKLALRYSEITEGLFNPFILPSLQKAGYKESFVDNKEVLDDLSNRNVFDFKNLKFGNDWILIPFGTAIDYGGIGKSYLADQLADYLDTYKLKGYWLSLGGDIAINGLDFESNNWIVKIQSVESDNEAVARFNIPSNSRMGIATSGVIKRRGEVNNQKWHHIIDPRTLKPAFTDIKSVSVCCNSTLDADIFAKCAVILGSNRSNELLGKDNVKSSLIQFENKQNKLIFKRLGNLIELEK